jgi:hypothetical protein
MKARQFIVSLIILSVMLFAGGTDVYYPDKSVTSSNSRYRVDAKSPDNKSATENMPFAENFTYTLQDLQTKKTLWTRKQKEDENSCVSLHVNDGGWTVIYTGWDELIIVNLKGKDVGKIRILGDAIKKDEREKYVFETTAGPYWTRFSLWYFADFEKREYFVIRTYWDKRIIIDLQKGKLVPEDWKLAKTLLEKEHAFVLSELEKAVKTREKWENEDYFEGWTYIFNAAFVAGRIGAKDAIPFLHKLEDINFVNSSTVGSVYELKPNEGDLDISSYHTFGLRRIVHLSLRRLGEKPGPYNCIQFHMFSKDENKHELYPVPKLKVPREDSVDKIFKGQDCSEVLNLIGMPDYIRGRKWAYDMDAKEPFTLVLDLDLDKNKISGITKIKPPYWKTEEADRLVQ